jgi:hypothetical protein
MSTISDPFTDADGTALSAHAFPGGFSWVKDPISTGELSINTNRVYPSGALHTKAFYAASPTPASADYTVRAVLDTSGGGSDFLDVMGRMQGGSSDNCYFVRRNNLSGNWDLFKRVGGVETQLTSDSAAATSTVELVMSGTSISFKTDGVTIDGVTDSDLPSTGLGGFGYPFSQTDTTDDIPFVTTFEMDCSAGFSNGAPISPLVFRSFRTSPRRTTWR